MTAFVSLDLAQEAAEKVYGGQSSLPVGWILDTSFGLGGTGQATGSAGGYVYALKPAGTDDGRRMLVFRGTEVTLTNMEDLFANVTDIGKTQFSELDDFVNPWLAQQLVAGRNIELVGHSLGGALVQWAINDTNMRDESIVNGLTSVLELARQLPDPNDSQGNPNPNFQIDPNQLHFTTFNAPGITHVLGGTSPATDRTSVVVGEHHVVIGQPPIVQGDPIHLLGGSHVGAVGTQLLGHLLDFVTVGDGLFTHTINKPEYWTSPVVPYIPLQLDLALAQSFANHYSQLGNSDGTVQGNTEAALRLALYASAVGVALGVGELGKQAEAAAQLAGLQFDRDVFADTLALPGVGINRALEVITRAADAAGRNVAQVQGLVGSALIEVGKTLTGAVGAVDGFVTGTLIPWITGTAQGIASAFSDFIGDIPGVFDLGRSLGFVESGIYQNWYEQASRDRTIDPALNAALDAANATLQQAGQTVVVQSGFGANPFNTAGFNPDTAPPAAFNMTEGQLKAITINLPFQAGAGGQRLSLTLSGPNAGGFVLHTNGEEILSQNGSFSLIIPEGHTQLVVGLQAKQDVSAASILTVTAQLLDVNGGATHTAHQEATIALAENGFPRDTGIPAGPFEVVYTGGDENNEYLVGGPRSFAIYGNGGTDVISESWVQYPIPGLDLFDGGAGDDILLGGDGSDYVIGGSGNDYSNIGDGDIFIGGEDNDRAITDTTIVNYDWTAIGDGSHYIDGGAGNDVLLGALGVDVLLGGDGDDVLRGENRPEGWIAKIFSSNGMFEDFSMRAFVSATGADDHLDGGIGNDLLVGDGGNDVLLGGEGNDTLHGESDFAPTLPGNDWLEGGGGNDQLYGGLGTDTLFGGSGNDLLVGDYANEPGADDILDGGAGVDELHGGGGNDLLIGGSENDRLFAQDGDDDLSGDAGDDELQGGLGDDALFGGTGADQLFGQEGNDSLFGEDGDDLVNGGLGNDDLDGGEGIDDVQGREGDDFLAGGAGNDFLYGDGNDPTVLSLVGGNDSLDGEEGDDLLWGGAGQDQLFGGDGTDQLVGDNGNDQLYGEAGNDMLVGDSTLFPAQAGPDLLDGGDGNDVLQGGGGDDELEGGDGDDVIFGEFGNVLGAPAGDDDLHGGLGNDRLVGGGGLDTYRFNLGDGSDSIEDNAIQSNRVVFGAGITAEDLSLDVATGDSLLVRVGNNGDALEIVGFGVSLPTDFHSIRQFEFADRTILTDSQLLARGFHLSAPVTGGTVLGTAYADHIEGSQVDDWIHGRDGNDVLNGGQGNDVLEGEDGDDELNGGSGNDRLYGSAGSNVLRGGEGNDLLDSAGVGDQLFGGMGDDNYHLWSASQIIGEDVNAGIDTVHLAPTASLTFQTPNNVENVTIQDDFPLDPTMQVNMVGNALDNVLSGSHRLDGQAGNDTLIGLGDNTFVFGRGYGHDTAQTGTQWYAHTGLDQVQFLAGVAPTDLVIENHANDLVVKINGTTDQLTVESHFVSPSNKVDQFVFSDGTVWSLNDIEGRVRAFVGSEADDTFYGTLGDDIIRGLGGNDQIRSSLGNDVLDGGAGSDFLEGWSGNDTYVFGRGYGQDYIDEQGDSSDIDTLQLVDGITPGDVTLHATPDFGGDAILTINNTTDELTLAGFFLFDSLRVDRIQFADGTTWDYTAMLAHTQGVELEGTDSSNSLYGNVTNDILSGLGGDDSLYGGAGNDTLLGGAGVDQLDGGTGSDTLDGGIGPDGMIGGSGNDLYTVDDVGDGVTEQAGQGADTVQSSVTYALGANVENLTLIGNVAINGTGNSLNNVLTGNGAVNALSGGAGNDTYVVGAGDTIVEAAGAGTDIIRADISWTLGTNVENLVLTGTAAVNGTGNSLANTLTGNNAANILNGGAGADRLIGGQGDDIYIVDNVSDQITELANEGLDTVQSSVTYTLAANVENLTLTGSGAINGTGNGLDNILTGNNAANRLTGGAGNDTYVIGSGDSIVESVNAGIDSVQSSVTHTLAANVENLTLTGSAIINGTGNGLNNILIGNSAVNTLTGGAGHDTYIVGVGDTVVEASNAGTDTVQSAVTWSLGANVENLVLVGSAAVNGTGNTLANVLTGNAGNNVLVGGDGNDTMAGGQGNDVLNGGTGNDVFQFARGDGQDTVTDTSGSSDRLNFGSGINPLDIMLSQSANDLRIALYGSTDQVTIANWYGGATNQIETVQAGNGQQLMSTQVNQLIQAMAGFTQQTGLSWEQAVAQRPQDVQQVLAANWH